MSVDAERTSTFRDAAQRPDLTLAQIEAWVGRTNGVDIELVRCRYRRLPRAAEKAGARVHQRAERLEMDTVPCATAPPPARSGVR